MDKMDGQKKQSNVEGPPTQAAYSSVQYIRALFLSLARHFLVYLDSASLAVRTPTRKSIATRLVFTAALNKPLRCDHTWPVRE